MGGPKYLNEERAFDFHSHEGALCACKFLSGCEFVCTCVHDCEFECVLVCISVRCVCGFISAY